jgi:hypothetical protein
LGGKGRWRDGNVRRQASMICIMRRGIVGVGIGGVEVVIDSSGTIDGIGIIDGIVMIGVVVGGVIIDGVGVVIIDCVGVVTIDGVGGVIMDGIVVVVGIS